jgi:uncharacterized membrane protein YcjF (UPF0283 family)
MMAHLAITGGIAATEGLVSQVLGHSLAARLSTRLGEGVINGLLTARVGIAAIAVTRPDAAHRRQRSNTERGYAGDRRSWWDKRPQKKKKPSWFVPAADRTR